MFVDYALGQPGSVHDPCVPRDPDGPKSCGCGPTTPLDLGGFSVPL